MKEPMPNSNWESWEIVLRSRIAPFPHLIFAGLVKNAGKTTALNAMNALFPEESVGLTSIGYDGEEHDAIYRHPKPPIFVHPRQLILTSERFLPDVKDHYEILEDWGEHPQYGAWVILRMTASSAFRMAGPSTLSELQVGLSKLQHHGATRLHVDGALNRLSHISLGSGVILSTGAALGNTLKEVTERTLHWLKLFQLPLFLSSSSSENQNLAPPYQQNAFLNDSTWFTLPTLLWQHDVKTLIPSHTDAIFLHGAFTDSIYLALRAAQRLPQKFIVRSPAHLLLSPAVFAGLISRGISVMLLERPSLLMITVNPWHPLTPIPTAHIAEALLPHTTVPLVDIEQHKIWLPNHSGLS